LTFRLNHRVAQRRQALVTRGAELRAQAQLIKQRQRIAPQQRLGAFPLDGGQQHRQQAAHDAPLAVAKEVHFSRRRSGMAEPDAVFTAGDLSSLRFQLLRQGRQLFAEHNQLAILVLPLGQRAKGLF